MENKYPDAFFQDSWKIAICKYFFLSLNPTLKSVKNDEEVGNNFFGLCVAYHENHENVRNAQND